MARARNIKPGFFTNEDLVELDFATRLLFAGLWTVADREGRLQDRPKKIKIDVFPADNLDIDAMLQALHDRKFITRYEVNGGKFIQISSWAKHQNPHHTEKASELPGIDGELTVKEPLKPSDPPRQDGGNLADSLIPDSLIPDSGFLIPDSASKRQFDAPRAGAASPPAAVVPLKPKAPKPQTPTADVWAAYSEAYRQRYQADPVRNATVNGQMAQLVARLGAAEAPEVARFFLAHRGAFYVKSMHSVGSLLSDCEKLRTEWVTGQQMTQTQAIAADKTQTNLNAFGPLIRAAQEREANERESQHG